MSDLHLKIEYKFGDVVSLKHGSDDSKGMVTSITVGAERNVMYGVSWGDRGEGDYYALELKLVAVAEEDFVR